MKPSNNQICRRDVLAGAATAVGASLLGVMPSLASAQRASGMTAQAYTLLYWSGTAFVLADRIRPGTFLNDFASVRIDAFGVSPRVSSIDVQLPGGTFEAFTAPPKGLRSASFNVPIAHMSGLPLVVGAGSSKTSLMLSLGSSAGYKLAPGVYMLTDAGVSWVGLSYTGSPGASVVDSHGMAVSTPYVLITVQG